MFNPMQVFNAIAKSTNPNQMLMQYARQNPAIREAMQMVNGKTYYFRTGGSMHAGWLELENDTYYLNEDGILLPDQAKKKQAYEQLAAYIFPPLTLLRESTSPGRDAINAELRANAETLIEKLESFHVKLSKIEYSRGPTLTRYELYPAPGVKANSIKNLQTDIAMALQAKIRIEAPIPGKSAVGVEVPNKSSSTVAIRELLDSDPFKNASSKV